MNSQNTFEIINRQFSDNRCRSGLNINWPVRCRHGDPIWRPHSKIKTTTSEYAPSKYKGKKNSITSPRFPASNFLICVRTHREYRPCTWESTRDVATLCEFERPCCVVRPSATASALNWRADWSAWKRLKTAETAECGPPTLLCFALSVAVPTHTYTHTHTHGRAQFCMGATRSGDMGLENRIHLSIHTYVEALFFIVFIYPV